MQERTNEQWLSELWGPDPNEALADLYDLLVRGLRAAWGGRAGGVDANVEDLRSGGTDQDNEQSGFLPGESRFSASWISKGFRKRR